MSTAYERSKASASFATWTAAAFRHPGTRALQARFALDALLLLAPIVVVAIPLGASADRFGRGWGLVFPLLVLGLLCARRAYAPKLRPAILDELRLVVTTTALAGMVVLTARVLTGTDPAAAGQVARQWALAAVGLGAGRILLGLWEIRIRQMADAGIPTIVVGAGRVGRLVARRLLQYPEFGLQPVGFLDDAPLDDASSTLPVLGGLGSLEGVVHEYGAERVIVAFSPASHEELLDVLRRCEQLGVTASFVPRFFETMKEKVQIDCVGSLPLVSVARTNPRGWQFAAKYAFDRLLGALLLVLFAPLLVATAVAVWATVGRPVFFRQLRVGRDGRPFEMLKFRSMSGSYNEPSTDLPPDTAPGGVEGDDRRTRLGRFMRRSSLDELPQLLNVVRGEMSLVGPRPERPEFAELFSESVHRYGERLRVKAGITGWAQIHGLRGRTSVADRAEWDNYYIDNWSVWLDVKILVLTVFALFRFPAD